MNPFNALTVMGCAMSAGMAIAFLTSPSIQGLAIGLGFLLSALVMVMLDMFIERALYPDLPELNIPYAWMR